MTGLALKEWDRLVEMRLKLDDIMDLVMQHGEDLTKVAADLRTTPEIVAKIIAYSPEKHREALSAYFEDITKDVCLKICRSAGMPLNMDFFFGGEGSSNAFHDAIARCGWDQAQPLPSQTEYLAKAGITPAEAMAYERFWSEFWN